MVRKMNSASVLLIDILKNAISILNNARKKKESSRMNCFYFDKGVG